MQLSHWKAKQVKTSLNITPHSSRPSRHARGKEWGRVSHEANLETEMSEEHNPFNKLLSDHQTQRPPLFHSCSARVPRCHSQVPRYSTCSVDAWFALRFPGLFPVDSSLLDVLLCPPLFHTHCNHNKQTSPVCCTLALMLDSLVLS